MNGWPRSRHSKYIRTRDLWSPAFPVPFRRSLRWARPNLTASRFSCPLCRTSASAYHRLLKLMTRFYIGSCTNRAWLKKPDRHSQRQSTCTQQFILFSSTHLRNVSPKTLPKRVLLLSPKHLPCHFLLHLWNDGMLQFSIILTSIKMLWILILLLDKLADEDGLARLFFWPFQSTTMYTCGSTLVGHCLWPRNSTRAPTT